ncbi:cob(I)yrinic acid a,c-diamide adenosyltransferase [Desulfogranum marinum]|uniref:cob(I)yrinic acid a,c-diamide adenosyltransferase n=1 Tax=Desulfogranum marinum TaxID=453220 RepID=UPI00196391ED|nr:cob(I)yrinic acid a,c-diamide adenosyltransferase [Desulfogranum marinum]MBM9512588.1 cob(I)yrinic acid a,c-diamide adenosyltransferase [Desulfogranum marinum]
MKVYTGGGDKGKTSLFSGERVAKYSLRIDSYGDLDELNSVIGAIHSHLPENTESIKNELLHIQARLFQAGAWLATTPESSAIDFLEELEESVVKDLENKIDELTAELTPLKEFILPGGTPGASWAHIGRTVCRRCERKVTQLVEEEKGSKIDSALQVILVYLNRLSDYLFVVARFANKAEGRPDQVWRQP